MPYKLKHYIDVLSMPGTLFGFEPTSGYFGMLKGKRATVVSTAAIYMPGLAKSSGTDHVTPPYLVDWLNFAGVSDVTSVWYYGSKMRGPRGGDCGGAGGSAGCGARSGQQVSGTPPRRVNLHVSSTICHRKRLLACDEAARAAGARQQ